MTDIRRQEAIDAQIADALAGEASAEQWRELSRLICTDRTVLESYLRQVDTHLDLTLLLAGHAAPAAAVRRWPGRVLAAAALALLLTGIVWAVSRLAAADETPVPDTAVPAVLSESPAAAVPAVLSEPPAVTAAILTVKEQVSTKTKEVKTEMKTLTHQLAVAVTSAAVSSLSAASVLTPNPGTRSTVPVVIETRDGARTAAEQDSIIEARLGDCEYAPAGTVLDTKAPIGTIYSFH